MQMTSGRAAISRRLTSAYAAWTRSTSARSSDGGRISSCGVWAQAKAATRGTRYPLPAAEEAAVVIVHPVEPEYRDAVVDGWRDQSLEVGTIVRWHAAEHPGLGVGDDLARGIESVDGQSHADGPPVGGVVDVAAELRLPLGVEPGCPLQTEPAIQAVGREVLRTSGNGNREDDQEG